ncbi:radical S-adenosyl methionine domain-containing protein 1, mitochondrial precursor [Danio rerio]|uniref:Radical S-adenosyl methionine domain-containing protein 1, mitochondrial n=1 Tax=Danio rerio TaxID=7955 RepID=RSAD1_DANRE|nr:radical S-adenosyl methionine domain-containing protein 1, mitochondrial precursor [Danio rerio]A4IGH2.1 RecName: Full=Radical S-adenosyl methionine domain-containing protein 1, mitochondrial; AltName: Full=Putative heme chaperone; Flags: Precursor [Danio rerio]AAI35100.1 Rsad1 protein [Danio rerio]|eukprot:NP_001077026.1 radical S-adenosyl methionine domain-containing protein 1, mitochondrial precursor [Danio rerio]
MSTRVLTLTLLKKRHLMQCFWSTVGSVHLRSIASDKIPSHAVEASLYVHWPYCLKRCSYCNFNKYISRSENHDTMTECLQKETETLLKLSQVSRITSVFFGGGTPSLAQPSTIAAVLETVTKNSNLSDLAEVTLEVNPTPAGKARLKDFTLAGVNRFSIGVQSLNADHLRILGRDHSVQHALQTVSEARKLCPGRVSVDIMFALPGQSVSCWQKQLEELLYVCDDHISLYQLTLERGTQLFKQVESGKLSVPGDEVTAIMYKTACRVLEESGFHQYEVSNFARNNAVSEHNMGYWRGHQYIGVGPGAHGRFVPHGDGGVQREARTQTLEPDVWIKEVQSRGRGTRRRITLHHLQLLEEVLVMGLRMNEGITHQHWELFSPEANLQQVFGKSANIQELQGGRFLILDDRGLRCSWEGLVLLDSILPTILLELEMFFHSRGIKRTQ